MSVTKLVSSKNLFINTDDAIDGDGISARFTVPPGVMDCKVNQYLQVTLASFNMRQGFYRINKYNNVFYVLSHKKGSNVVKSTRVQLVEGDYDMFWTNDDELPAEPGDNAATGVWQRTVSHPNPLASQSTTLATQIKFALLNSVTHDITATETADGTFTYTSVASAPAFEGPESSLHKFDSRKIKVSYDRVKGSIILQLNAMVEGTETALSSDDFKVVGFYCKNYVDRAKELNIYTQIVTTPDGPNTLDLFSSSFEIMGGCGETRSVPIGTTVEEQFENLRTLTFFRLLPRVGRDTGTIISMEATADSPQITNVDAAVTESGYITIDSDATGVTINPALPTDANRFDLELLFNLTASGTGNISKLNPRIAHFPPSDFTVGSTITINQAAIRTASGNLFQNAVMTGNYVLTVTKVGTSGELELKGQYKATLQSEECLYLRTDLPFTNYQTLGFDTGERATPEIQPTQIFAKIPLNNPITVGSLSPVLDADGDPLGKVTTSIFQIPFEYINYKDDGGDLYSIRLNTPHVNQMRIFLTDSYGRPIPFASQEQGLCKALSFSCDLRIDTMQEIIQKTLPLK